MHEKKTMPPPGSVLTGNRLKPEDKIEHKDVSTAVSFHFVTRPRDRSFLGLKASLNVKPAVSCLIFLAGFTNQTSWPSIWFSFFFLYVSLPNAGSLTCHVFTSHGPVKPIDELKHRSMRGNDWHAGDLAELLLFDLITSQVFPAVTNDFLFHFLALKTRFKRWTDDARKW